MILIFMAYSGDGGYMIREVASEGFELYGDGTRYGDGFLYFCLLRGSFSALCAIYRKSIENSTYVHGT